MLQWRDESQLILYLKNKEKLQSRRHKKNPSFIRICYIYIV